MSRHTFGGIFIRLTYCIRFKLLAEQRKCSTRGSEPSGNVALHARIGDRYRGHCTNEYRAYDLRVRHRGHSGDPRCRTNAKMKTKKETLQSLLDIFDEDTSAAVLLREAHDSAGMPRPSMHAKSDNWFELATTLSTSVRCY